MRTVLLFGKSQHTMQSADTTPDPFRDKDVVTVLGSSVNPLISVQNMWDPGFCFYVLFPGRYIQHSNIRLLVWIHGPLIKLHLMENSMIQSSYRSAIMLSRRPLNIFTVFNELHMATSNISLVWSTLHFHPKQIHSVNWVSKRLQTKTHRHWQRIHEGVCVGSSQQATRLFVFKQMFVHRQYLEFLLGSVTLQHAGGNTMQVHNGWFNGFISIKRGTDKCRRQRKYFLF